MDNLSQLLGVNRTFHGALFHEPAFGFRGEQYTSGKCDYLAGFGPAAGGVRQAGWDCESDDHRQAHYALVAQGARHG